MRSVRTPKRLWVTFMGQGLRICSNQMKRLFVTYIPRTLNILGGRFAQSMYSCTISHVWFFHLYYSISIASPESIYIYFVFPRSISQSATSIMLTAGGQSRLTQFVVESKLGEGSFSCVYKVRRLDDGKCYAMKKVKIGQMKEKEKENALNEVRILASISHPNIVNYRDAFFDDRTQTLCVVMQLADAGDIQKRINDHLKYSTHYNQPEIWQALVQMTRGLKALHEINILHRDLKCANVFCTSDRCYKLGDLNVSKVAKRGMARTQTGTPYYTSPEVWNDRPYDAKCDIWSLGCVIYEMATLRPPFRANNLKELYAKIQKGIYEPLPKFYSEDLRQVVAMCLRVVPSQRISATELLALPTVLRNMPASEYQSQSNGQTSKCSLLKTIMVPKNLKSLKEALPAAKYEQPAKQDLQKFRRANSANQIRQDLPQVIESPKAGNLQQQQLKYALMKRPSQQRGREASSERDVRPMPRMERNNSVDYIRKRVESNNSIENSRKDSSRELSREMPRPAEQVRPIVKEIPRPSSREGRISSQQRVVAQNSSREQANSRERVNSRDSSRDGRQNMEDIKNRCKDIEERVKLLLDRKKEQKEQRNPNLPVIRQEVNKIRDPRYFQRQPSRERELSRNKSIQLARQESANSNRAPPNEVKRSNERPSSRERLASIERSNSREIEKRRNGSIRYL